MGSVKLVFGIFVMVAAIYLIVVLAPPYFSNYQFQDALRTEAQMDTYNTKTEDQIRDLVFKKAQDLDVPVTREQIKVQRSGVTGSGSVSIEAPYTVHISLPGYPFDLDFDPSSRNKGVM
ncbi:MAG: hypothetical protein WBQ68_15665 [Terriglobales bacterium]|jgi:hypothetical protein